MIYIVDQLVLHKIYVLNKEIFQFLGQFTFFNQVITASVQHITQNEWISSSLGI